MTAPQRLLEAGAPGADLLAAARDDGPSAASRRAIAAALGLGAGAATVAGASTAAAATTATTATKAAGLSLVAKLTIGAALLVGAGVGVTRIATSDEAAARPTAPVVTSETAPVASPAPAALVEPMAPVEPAPVEPAPVEPAPVEPAPVEPAPGRPVRRPRTTAAVTMPPAQAKPASASTLADEVKLLDRAVFAMRSKDVAAALAHLDTYDRTYPHGVLRPEAAVARIEAELARGQRERASQLGQAFLAAHPDSPLAKRVRAIIEQ